MKKVKDQGRKKREEKKKIEFSVCKGKNQRRRQWSEWSLGRRRQNCHSTALTVSQLMPVMVVIKEEETGVTVPQKIKINKKDETR